MTEASESLRATGPTPAHKDKGSFLIDDRKGKLNPNRYSGIIIGILRRASKPLTIAQIAAKAGRSKRVKGTPVKDVTARTRRVVGYFVQKEKYIVQADGKFSLTRV